jgi:hypothetical protein
LDRPLELAGESLGSWVFLPKTLNREPNLAIELHRIMVCLCEYHTKQASITDLKDHLSTDPFPSMIATNDNVTYDRRVRRLKTKPYESHQFTIQFHSEDGLIRVVLVLLEDLDGLCLTNLDWVFKLVHKVSHLSKTKAIAYIHHFSHVFGPTPPLTSRPDVSVSLQLT